MRFTPPFHQLGDKYSLCCREWCGDRERLDIGKNSSSSSIFTTALLMSGRRTKGMVGETYPKLSIKVVYMD